MKAAHSNDTEDEFGNKIATSGSGDPGNKSFVGGLGVVDELADTGLHLMSQRWMDPKLGRFLNRDPIGYAGGLNLFNYPTNPVNEIDPTGMIPLYKFDRRLDYAVFKAMNAPGRTFESLLSNTVGSRKFAGVSIGQLKPGENAKTFYNPLYPRSVWIVFNENLFQTRENPCSSEIQDDLNDLLASVLVHELKHASMFISNGGSKSPLDSELAGWGMQKAFAKQYTVDAAALRLAAKSDPTLRPYLSILSDNQAIVGMNRRELINEILAPRYDDIEPLPPTGIEKLFDK